MAIKNLIPSLVFVCMMISGHACHSAKIICDTDASNVTKQLVIAPNDDLYAFSTINIEPSFRLSGQYLPSLNKFKLYAYSHSKDRYVLLSAQEFEITPQMCARSFGKNLIYGEPYERELFFQCRYVCQD
jgi:hypothetical protein